MAEHKNYLRNLEQDILYFLNMCTKDDAKLFISNPKQKKIEDYGRFICLGLAFGLRGVMLNTFAQYENVGNIKELFAYLDTLTFERVIIWVEKFSEEIEDPLFKECAESIWEEKKKYFANHKFEIAKLF